MKKLHYNYLPADGNGTGKAAKSKTQTKTSVSKITPTPPDEETIKRLNAIAREYPFCVNFRQNGISLL